LLKLYYSIHNSIPICERGVVAAYHVVRECIVEQWLGVRRRTPRRRWVDNIRMDLQEVGCGYMDWIGLAQDRES